MDLKNLGGKWLQTVKSAGTMNILGSAAPDRPEIPARAAAAAAVAVQIAGLPQAPRASRPSTSAVPSAFIKPTREPPEELEECFFGQEFDPVRHMLEHIPTESVDQTFFDNKVAVRMAQLDLITQKLSKQVMEHHEEMVRGMELVTELDKDLQVSSIISKNGRRHLFLAMHEVSQDLVVSSNVRKKQVLLDMLPVVERIQHSIELQSRLQSMVDEGNYARALQACSECMMHLNEFSELAAIKEMNHSIEEWLQGTIEKVDAVLQSVCRKFQSEGYLTVLDAYSVMDDIAGLGEKVQTFFAQTVVSETHKVIKDLVNQEEDAQVALKKSRLPYNDLCLQLPESKFRPCLSKILEVLFDLLCSYYQMMTFQQFDKGMDEAAQRGSQFNPLTNGKRQLSVIPPLTLTDTTSNVESQVVRQDSSQQATATASGNLSQQDAANRIDAGEAQLISQRTPGERGVIMGSEALSNRARQDTAVSVGAALEKGRKTVWELAARRVSALLSSDALCASSPHHFLRSLDWVNKFIVAGEAFCGAEAVSLRSKLLKQSKKYFGTFHRQNLEVMRMMLEKESWQQLSATALQAVNLAGLTGEGGSVLAIQGTQAQEGGELMERSSSQTGFSTWLQGGNPFINTHTLHTEGDKLENSLGGINGTSNEPRVTGDDESEDEDLLADFIDEDSQLPSRLSMSAKLMQGTVKQSQGQGIAGFTLTGSAVSMLRYMDKYARLMQILQPISVDVMKGLCQFFELYFFTIFKAFGQREAFSVARSQSDAPALITARLRTTLVRISQGLEEQRMKSQGPDGTVPSSPGAPSHAHGFTEGSPMSPGQAGPPYTTSMSKMYDIKERTVAAESLMCMAQILKKSRTHLQMMLPQEALTSTEQFYSRTVDAVPDLREHVYRTLARNLLNVGGYVDRISNVRWELKDLGLEHNGHIDLLLGEYKRFLKTLSNEAMSKEVLELFLEYGVDTLAETLLEGLSRVKRCNNEGRALMSLDLQVLINGLQKLAPPKLRTNLQIVETYIKAFYLPETEYLHWIRTHPEYTKTQIVALVNLVASANNWKRRSRLDILEKIDAVDS